jgi:hypothetical protein
MRDLTFLSLTLLLAACSAADRAPAAGRNTDSAPAASSPRDSTPVAASPTTGTWVVRLHGAGSMVFGATLAEANRASGGKFAAPGGQAGCASVRVPGSPPGMRFMVETGHVVRVDVDSVGVMTDRSAGVGMSETDVQHAYGDSLRVMPQKYDPAGHYLIYTPAQPADSSLRIVFETDGKTVTRYRAGVEPAVEYVEGCG